MRFIVVDENILKEKCKRKSLKHVFMEFMRMNVKAVQVDFTEFDYKSVDSAYNNLHKGAKKHSVPVRVIKNGDSIYFVRTDI